MFTFNIHNGSLLNLSNVILVTVNGVDYYLTVTVNDEEFYTQY